MPGVDGGKSALPPKHPVPPPPMAAVTGALGSAGSFQASGPYQTTASSFQPPATGYLSPQPAFGGPPPSQAVAETPPLMFSPQTQSQVHPGFRKSPYVAPDFVGLPSSQSQGTAGPPPMGPAPPGGYRRGQQ